MVRAIEAGAGDLMDEIISLEDEDPHVNIMVYGKSGCGKTVWAGSGNKVLFLAPEDDGTMAAQRQGSKAKKLPIKTWADLERAYDWLYDLGEEDAIPFDWIVIDSITHMQQMLLREILDNVVEENASRDPDIPAIQDYQKWQNMFKRFVLFFNSLPVNVLWTALVRNETDEEGNDFTTPDIQGKGYQMSQTIASYMTSYGLMQVKRVKIKPKNPGDEPTYRRRREIIWEDTGIVQGKDRTDVLAPKTVDKSLAEITDMIFSPAEPEVTEKAPRPGARKVASTQVKAEV